MNKYYITAKKIILFFLLTYISLNLTGCSLLESPSSLLTMPDTYIEGESSIEINELLGKYNYVLTCPTAGPDKRSIVKADFNNDKANELILLYKKANESSNFGILLLGKYDEKLIILDDIKLTCSNINSMILKDITNDDFLELIITTQNTQDSNKTLNVYFFDGDKFQSSFTNQYIDMLIDSNFSSEAPYFLVANKNSLSAYIYRNNKFEIIDSVLFDDKINNVSLHAGNYTATDYGIFCTFNYDNNYIITEIYDLSNHSLKKVFNYPNDKIKYMSYIQNMSPPSNFYRNYYNINSFVDDINDDGICEFRVTNTLSALNSAIKNYNFNYWYNYYPANNGTYNFHLTLATYFDIHNRFILKIPGSLISKQSLKCTTLNYTDYESLSFTKTDGTTSKWIFSINIYKNNRPPYLHTQKDNVETIIIQNLNNTYLVCFDKDSFNNAQITEEYIEKLFFDFNTISILER